MAKSPHLSRSDFVKGTVGLLGGIMGAVIGIPAIGYVIGPALRTKPKETWIPLGKMEAFPVGVPTLASFVRATVNGWEKSSMSYGVFVYRSSAGEIITYSNICTHLGCRVNWNTDQQEFLCPCHSAVFNIDGKVVSGPPPQPMFKYENKVDNDQLLIRYEEF
jgi:menaquinol-cytochrome c reductase iron-sulfur subunit